MYCTCAHLCYPPLSYLSLSLPFLSVEERLKPIPKLVFSQHVKDMHKDRDRVFELEYQVMIISVYCYSYLWFLSLQSLTNPTIIPHEAAEHPVNRAKNRFANIKPCEKWVLLSTVKPELVATWVMRAPLYCSHNARVPNIVQYNTTCIIGPILTWLDRFHCTLYINEHVSAWLSVHHSYSAYTCTYICHALFCFLSFSWFFKGYSQHYWRCRRVRLHQCFVHGCKETA